MRPFLRHSKIDLGILAGTQSETTMITQTMVQPSSWVEGSVRLEKVRGLNLFKFTEDLQLRLEILIDRQKTICSPLKKPLNWRASLS